MKILGLMSGTSLDGLDLAYVDFDDHNPARYQILEADTFEYDAFWKKQLEEAFRNSGEKLMELHARYGEFLGESVKRFLDKYHLPAPDYVASHGQTVFHQPEKGFTFQLGSGAHLAAVSGVDTICDFRVQDVALGGQGAPLVPVGDKLLFGEYEYCLNLGGFANISYDDNNGRRIAFDIAPANIVLNYYAGQKGKKYDEGGKWAAAGKMDSRLLEALNKWHFYQKQPPKSLGWEQVEREIIPLIDEFGLDIKDILRTYVEHLARQIAAIVHDGKVLVTGGGALNDFLVERMRENVQAEIIIPPEKIILFKEALIFALLGYLKIKGEINVYASVTGASRDHVAGIIYPA